MPTPGKMSIRLKYSVPTYSHINAPAPKLILEQSKLAEAMNLPLVEAANAKLWALGPESIGGKALVTAEAPELSLADVDGKVFNLSSLKGKKVLVYAWAPY